MRSFLIVALTSLFVSMLAGVFGMGCGVYGPPQAPMPETPQDSEVSQRPSPSPSALPSTLPKSRPSPTPKRRR